MRPSRSCVISGQNNGRSDIRLRSDVVENRQLPNSPSIGEVLKKAGYVTAFLGKSGLGELGSTGMPTRQGFDMFYGFFNHQEAHHYYPTHIWRNEQLEPVPGNTNEPKTDYTTDLLTQEALDFIADNANRPFFISLNHIAPHAANTVQPPFMPIPADEPSWPGYIAKGWPDNIARRAAIITRMDRKIGEIIDALHSHGIASNTIVMFTSDNGPLKAYPDGETELYHNSNGDLRGEKRSLYEGGIRVPLIVYWPGHVPTGHVSDVQGAFLDILPTCAELAGAEHEA